MHEYSHQVGWIKTINTQVLPPSEFKSGQILLPLSFEKTLGFQSFLGFRIRDLSGFIHQLSVGSSSTYPKLYGRFKMNFHYGVIG